MCALCFVCINVRALVRKVQRKGRPILGHESNLEDHVHRICALCFVCMNARALVHKVQRKGRPILGRESNL